MERHANLPFPCQTAFSTGIISARIGNPVSRPGSINPARSTLAASIARQRPSRLDSALLSSSDPPFDALPSVTT